MPVSGPEGETDLADPPSLNMQGPPAVSAQAKPFNSAELLSRVWQQSLPLIRERVISLERAAHDAANETLSAGARTEASDLAHKLAGSLGMFGYPRGTEISREIEHMLEDHGEIDTARFVALAAELRTVLSL